MSREKQIDEMAKLICTYPQCIHYNIIGECANTECQTVDIAENLYAAGYRKHSEGKWLQGVNNSKVCSICGKEPLYTASGTAFATTFYRVKSNYCPNCGARMKGEQE